MAGKRSYELHHHFPRVADESGFTFNIHRPRAHIDWNKFRLIDIDGLIRERKFTLIEQHMNDILQCVLESEFDVRILDEGVVKMFRMAQLAIEYQQFCRHYLDRSVFVLREEITALAQELDMTKKELREKDEEIRKMKKKTKHTYRTPLPYGNDNIATMILKTLANKGDIFPTTSNGDTLQYNKCSYCDKVFLNQLYLQSHLSRRHPNVVEIPQKDIPDNVQRKSEQENTRLNDEVMALKLKLKEMENMIAKANNLANTANTETKTDNLNIDKDIVERNMKDAEVSTNNEDYLLDKIEEWKREEHEKYNKEINLLRSQILETINSIKEKEALKQPQNDPNVNLIEQLHATIKQQGAEIVLLKNELRDSELKSQNEKVERKAETDSQTLLWNRRAEAQMKQYESLLQKLNEVAQEARESRATADAERERATQLQVLLQQSLNNQVRLDTDRHNHHYKENSKTTSTIEISTPTKTKNKKSLRKSNPVADRNTLENLHRKAQELLKMKSTDSSSDISTTSLENQPNLTTTEKLKVNVNQQLPPNGYNVNKESQRVKNKLISKPAMKNHNRETNTPEPKVKKNKSKPRHYVLSKVGNGVVVPPGSPLKLVRARLTEEVNSRLVSAGIDPLKNRMPQQVFKKQRMQLQHMHDFKSKKNPAYQKTRHSILAFLDSTTSNSKKREIIENQDYTSPTKLTKPFSFTNVISNVKNKALSLVKPNDMTNKTKRNTLNAEVARKAMSLLKTPPDSMNTSPAIQRKIIDLKVNSPGDAKTKLLTAKSTLNSESNIIEKMRQNVKSQAEEVAVDSDDDSDESDNNYYCSQITQQSTKSIESLIKSPARRPSSANADYNGSVRKYVIDSEPYIARAQSESNISEHKKEVKVKQFLHGQSFDNSSDEVESLVDIPMKKIVSVENIKEVPKQTKGVLKNASSTSSLNKKKVLFDMDAIQMKSVSASPSQSTTEKSDDNEKFELGLLNLDGEEWDISSIENEPLKNDTKIQVNSRTSPKIAELKQTIESQLARRNETPTALVGGVNLMPTPMPRTSSVAGSNTSLGSSILDESDGMPPVVNHKTFVRPKRVADKEDSEIDISEYSLDGVSNKKRNDSF